MFAVGHLAAGYLVGKTTSKILRVHVKVPVLLALSTLPDIDLIIPQLAHRGPTHSLITIAILSIPIFLMYRKTAIVYFMAIVQHSLLGDFITGGAQLFWPLNQNWYGIELCQISTLRILNEWALFILFVAIMLKLGDLRTLLKPHRQNLLLILPISTIVSPLFLDFPMPVPITLYVPHVVCLTVLSLSLLNDIRHLIRKL